MTRIKVVCDRTDRHPKGRTATVALLTPWEPFEPMDEGDNLVSRRLSRGWNRALAERNRATGTTRWDDAAHDVTTGLDGDAPLMWDSDLPGEPRGRYEFTCPDCGYTVARRAEDLDPRLDAAAAAGVTTVPLRALSS